MMKPENKEMAEKIILDTDLGTDCDDAGAIAMLINMASEGKAEILGMTHCASEMSGVIAVKAICDWYGAENMPIGRLTRYSFLEGEKYQRFTGEVSREYEKVNGTSEFEDSVKLMRTLLAENSGVTLIRPMIYLREGEITSCATRQNMPVITKTCPIDGLTERHHFKALLREEDRRHRGVYTRILGALERSGVDSWHE